MERLSLEPAILKLEPVILKIDKVGLGRLVWPD